MENPESNEALHDQLKAVVAEMMDAGISPNKIKQEVDGVTTEKAKLSQETNDQQIQQELAAYISAHKEQLSDTKTIQDTIDTMGYRERGKTIIYTKDEWEKLPAGTAGIPEDALDDDKSDKQVVIAYKGSDNNIWRVVFRKDEFDIPSQHEDIKYIQRILEALTQYGPFKFVTMNSPESTAFFRTFGLLKRHADARKKVEAAEIQEETARQVFDI